ncbi:hypothetical protein DPSP01_013283 [Paraphaeosphaeria sporulosa]
MNRHGKEKKIRKRMGWLTSVAVSITPIILGLKEHYPCPGLLMRVLPPKSQMGETASSIRQRVQHAAPNKQHENSVQSGSEGSTMNYIGTHMRLAPPKLCHHCKETERGYGKKLTSLDLKVAFGPMSPVAGSDSAGPHKNCDSRKNFGPMRDKTNISLPAENACRQSALL